MSSGEFDKPTKHSSIIGWAYDGNPIYGPFGYSRSNNINSTFALKSSYVNDITKVENRPSGFDAGYFIDDYIFDNSGDLDIYIMEDFARHSEFPNGVYAYFATVDEDNNGKLLVNIHIL